MRLGCTSTSQTSTQNNGHNYALYFGARGHSDGALRDLGGELCYSIVFGSVGLAKQTLKGSINHVVFYVDLFVSGPCA